MPHVIAQPAIMTVSGECKTCIMVTPIIAKSGFTLKCGMDFNNLTWIMSVSNFVHAESAITMIISLQKLPSQWFHECMTGVVTLVHLQTC